LIAAVAPDGDSAARATPLPVVFVLEGDRFALDVLVSDLSRRFGNDFTVIGATSGPAALAELQELAAKRQPVAMLLVESAAVQRFLPRAHGLHPRAMRVALVDRDYSSTSPVVQAMTLGRVDYHITRPWTTEEAMFRAMSEYLAAWTRQQDPAFEEFRLVAPDGDSRAVELRDVMTRFSIPFGSYPAHSERGRHLLNAAGVSPTPRPVLIRYDGKAIVDPGLPDLAHAIGVQVETDVETADLTIIGAGPAGLSAAVYGASEGLETVMLELAVSGGQAGSSPLIRNYPGFPHGVDGGQLMERTCEQAWLMGAHIVFAQQAVGLDRRGEDRVVRLLDGTEVHSRAVVLATGIQWRRLGVPELESLVGAGVFYGAAVSESRVMQGQNVFIIGGGNSAGQAALHLAKYARAVTLVIRGPSIAKSMSSYLVHAVESDPTIKVRLNTEVVGGGGSEWLEHLDLADRVTNTTERVDADAVFVMIGGQPNTGWLPDEIARDRGGYLITGRDLGKPSGGAGEARESLPLETSMPGVFAAGDVRQGSIKRVASAVGDGATAVRLVHEYLR
jgi:thioredoxin reductase (NADPH)